MTISVGDLGYVRKYLFSYVTGVLWLMFGAMSLNDFRPIDTFASIVGRAGGQLTNETATLVLVTFTLLLGGIALPYCIGIVFNPIAVTLLDLGQLLTKRLVSKREREDRAALGKRVYEVVSEELGTAVRCHHNDVLLIVELKSPREAAVLRSMFDNVYFRGTATVPSALLFGSFVAGYMQNSTSGIVVGTGCALLLMGLGIYHANVAMLSHTDRVAMAVLVLSHK